MLINCYRKFSFFILLYFFLSQYAFASEFVSVKAILNGLVDDNTAPSIASGTIFLTCNLCNKNITKKDVSKACKISEVTISKCYKKLFSHRLELFPKSAIKKYNIK